jgi:Na+-transporting methylmalonyl-CoA/oxaloacetate decarboxylase gamma subunit
LVPIIPILIFISILVFAITAIRRMEHRAEERLKLSKENIALQQQQIQEINKRLTTIESILKEVE